MRFSLKTMVVALLLSSALFAQTKVGVINSAAILASHKGTQAAETKLRAKMELWQKQIEQKQQDLMKMQEDFQAQAMLMSASQKQAKEIEFQKAGQALQVFAKDKEQEGMKLRDQLLKPITSEVNDIIQAIAISEGYDVVFDENGQIVYAKDNLNLTEKVLAKMK